VNVKYKTQLWLFYGGVALAACDGYLLLGRALASVAEPISVPKVLLALVVQLVVLAATYAYLEVLSGSPVAMAVSYLPQRLRHLPLLAILGVAVVSIVVLNSGLSCGELPLFTRTQGALGCS